MAAKDRQTLDTRPQGLLRFYYRIVLTAVTAVLVLHVLLQFVLGTGRVLLTPQRIVLYGAILLLAGLGHETVRGAHRAVREPRGLLLAILGLLLVLFCVESGGLGSAYYMLVLLTCVFGALLMRGQKAFLLTSVIAAAYCAALTVYPRQGGLLEGGVEGFLIAVRNSPRPGTEDVAALTIQCAFLFVGCYLAARLAVGFREEVVRLEAHATRDPLTGLPNRRGFTEKLDLEMQRALQWDWPIALLVVDLDEFKKVNDRYGHPVGDSALVDTAGLLRDAAGPLDHLARLGGEEFAVAAVGADRRHGADLADRVVRNFRNHNWGHIQPGLKVTCSVGVAVMLPGREGSSQEDVSRLMDRADQALLQVKKHGRNGYLVEGDIPNVASLPRVGPRPAPRPVPPGVRAPGRPRGQG